MAAAIQPDRTRSRRHRSTTPRTWSRHRDHVHVGAGDVRRPRPGRGPQHRRRGRRRQPGPLPAASRQGRCRPGCRATMVGATAGLVAFSLGLTVVAGPLFGYTGRAAQRHARPRRLHLLGAARRVAMSPAAERQRDGRPVRPASAAACSCRRGLADGGVGRAVGRPVGRQRRRRARWSPSWSAWSSRCRRCGCTCTSARCGWRWLVLHFLGDVVVASAQVAWTTLQLRRQPRNAVIEVDLRTRTRTSCSPWSPRWSPWCPAASSSRPGGPPTPCSSTSSTPGTRPGWTRCAARSSPSSAASYSPSAPRSSTCRAQLPTPKESPMTAVLAVCVGHPGGRRAAARRPDLAGSHHARPGRRARRAGRGRRSAGSALEAAVHRHTTTLPILVVLSLLGFVGSVSIARFTRGSDDVEAEQS